MKNKFRLPGTFLYLALVLPMTMAAAASLAAADDEPTIMKDFVRVTAHDDNKDPGAWRPGIAFRVNGPISSGSQLYVEFSLPAKPKWVEFDCDTGEIKKGEWWKVECRAGVDKALPFTGTVGFTIRLRNELHGTNATLFTGKAKVVKIPQYAGAKSFDYYVVDDWTIPIGYVYYQDFEGRGSIDLKVGFWYRGAPPANSCHLFYQGKEIANDKNSGNDAGDWDPSEHVWGMEQCQFQGVYRTQQEADKGDDPNFSTGAFPRCCRRFADFPA